MFMQPLMLCWIAGSSISPTRSTWASRPKAIVNCAWSTNSSTCEGPRLGTIKISTSDFGVKLPRTNDPKIAALRTLFSRIGRARRITSSSDITGFTFWNIGFVMRTSRFLRGEAGDWLRSIEKVKSNL